MTGFCPRTDVPKDLLFLGDELSASSLGCGNDLFEALITAQRIPAWIEAESHFAIQFRAGVAKALRR